MRSVTIASAATSSRRAKADCIQFGERDALSPTRIGTEFLHRAGEPQALYGEHELGGLGVFYLLMAGPEVYGLPLAPRRALLRDARDARDGGGAEWRCSCGSLAHERLPAARCTAAGACSLRSTSSAAASPANIARSPLAQLTAARGRAPVIRFGYGAALPLIAFGSLLLLLDLTRPLRFRACSRIQSDVAGVVGQRASPSATWSRSSRAGWRCRSPPRSPPPAWSPPCSSPRTPASCSASADPRGMPRRCGRHLLASALATAAAAIVLCARPGSAWLLQFLVLAAGLQALLLAAHLWCAARLPRTLNGGVAKLFGGRGGAFLAARCSSSARS
ncbi:MAG: hypothetical protein U1E76_15520 [Planctomycetota bacterium]